MLSTLLPPIEDDTEDSAWTAMGTPKSGIVVDFHGPLRSELRTCRPDLFVAAMLPVLFAPNQGDRVEQLAPRITVACVPDVRWEPDAMGRLYSDVLDLWLAVREGELRAQRPDGVWLRTLLEEIGEQEETKAARVAAEAETARLRAELESRNRTQA